MTRHPLSEVLARIDADVGTWIAKVADWDPRTVREEAARCADTIAHYADLLWRPAPKGRAACGLPTRGDIVGAIACGTAIAAHRPDGVHLAGRHWCTEAAECWFCGGEEDPPAFDLEQVHIGDAAAGAHYTPRWLAEEVAWLTLAAHLCDPGPLQTGDRGGWLRAGGEHWRPLRVADIACGSGAFLLAATRLIARSYTTMRPRPDAMESYYRAAANTAVYGADLNPWSVDLACLAVGLLAPHHATHRLRRNLVSGDSLIEAPHFPDRRGVDWRGRYPEVFAEGAKHGPGFDAVIGNPPFLGGNKLTGALGAGYRNHLIASIARGQKGSADLAAYFALRAHQLTNGRGQVGLVTTNTIGQGATREVGLDQIVEQGAQIRAAVQSMPWPGAANVHVSVVVTTRPPMRDGAGCILLDALKEPGTASAATPEPVTAPEPEMPPVPDDGALFSIEELTR